MDNFYDIEYKDLTYFELITLKFNKNTGETHEWDNLFTIIENKFTSINSNFLMLIDISLVNFPGLQILNKCSSLLKKYQCTIDEYCIESSIVISQSNFAKIIINTLFTIYKSRKPVNIKYSYDETYNNILEVVEQYRKN